MQKRRKNYYDITVIVRYFSIVIKNNYIVSLNYIFESSLFLNRSLRELPAFCVCTRCVSFFYPPNCINAFQKVNLNKMHPAAFYFFCKYTNGH